MNGSLAFSLVEMVAALAIAAVLVGAIASAAVMVRQAIPREGDPLQAALDASEVLDQIAAEVAASIYVLDNTPTAITLVVPDRTGDGEPDAIRYAWSGTPGDPLTRRINGGVETNIIPQVQSFLAAYTTESTHETYPGPEVIGPQVLVAGYDSHDDLRDEPVQNTKWWAQAFTLDIAPAARTWLFDRAAVQMREDLGTGTQTRIRIEGVGGNGYPDGNIRAEATVPQSVLNSQWQWRDIPFQTPPRLSPGDPVSLTFSTVDASSARLRIRDWNATVPGGGWVRGGPSWNARWNPRALLFKAFGREVFDGPPITFNRTQLLHVDLALQAGSLDTGPTLRRRVGLINHPPILNVAWRTDFAANPTLNDANGDGTPDWAVDAAGGDTTPVAGVWAAGSQTLMIQPTPTLYYPTLLDVRFRHTGGVSDAALIDAILRHDSGTPQVHLLLTLRRESDGTQTLTLHDRTAASNQRELARVAALAQGFHHVRALLSPQLGHVRLELDGRWIGTYAYATYPPSGATGVRLYGNGAEFDSIAFEAGGTTTAQPNTPPDAVASSNRTSIDGGGRVYFYANASSDPDAQALSYRWDFGDGTVSTLPNPSHDYDDDLPQGWITATLTVTDPFGLSDSDAISIYHSD